jgi:hypothetical protein
MMTKVLLTFGVLISIMSASEGNAQERSSHCPMVFESDTAYYPESRWGQPPAKITKELVYLQYPQLLTQDDSDLNTDDSLEDSTD